MLNGHAKRSVDEIGHILKQVKQNESSSPSTESQEIDNFEESAATSNATEAHLAEIMKTRDKISEVKRNLNILIDCIAANPSIINSLSEYWGSMSMSQKATPLVLSAAPLMFVATSPVVIAAGAVGLIYTTFAALLEDNHVCNEFVKQRLKDGIEGIADILEATIVSLDNICLRLSLEVEKFQEENLKLAGLVQQLQQQLSDLDGEIKILHTTERGLNQLQQDLVRDIATLKQSSEEKSERLVQQQTNLDQALSDSAVIREKLNQKTSELNQLRKDMSNEVTKTKQLSKTLNTLLNTLSTNAIEDEQLKQGFQSKLVKVVNGEEQTVERLGECMTKTQVQLEAAATDLKKSSERNNSLLEEQEKLFIRLNTLLVVANKQRNTYSSTGSYPGTFLKSGLNPRKDSLGSSDERLGTEIRI